jgi:hypothetical protein
VLVFHVESDGGGLGAKLNHYVSGNLPWNHMNVGELLAWGVKKGGEVVRISIGLFIRTQAPISGEASDQKPAFAVGDGRRRVQRTFKKDGCAR